MRMIGKSLFRFGKASSKDRIVFFGSDCFAIPTVSSLAQKYSSLQVMTHYSNPKRKLTNDVEIFCKKQQIEYSIPIRQRKGSQVRKQEWSLLHQRLAQEKPYLGIVCSFGYMIPSKIIDAFEAGMIIIHPSLLPKYRGGAPIFHTIANGDKQSGVSFISISKGKFDYGNILKQVTTELNPEESFAQVESKLAEVCGSHIISVVQNLESLQPGKSQADLENGIEERLLRAPILKSKRLNINQTAENVYNWSRALQKSRVLLQGKQIMVYFSRETMERQQFRNLAADSAVGTLVQHGKKVYMQCTDRFLRMNSWQEISKNKFQMYTFIDRFMNKSDGPVVLQ